MPQLAAWILAGFLNTSLPNYTGYARRAHLPMKAEVQPYVRVTPREPERKSYIVRPSADETLRIAHAGLSRAVELAQPGSTYTPSYDIFSKVVIGTWNSAQARDNVYYHAPKIADLSAGPVVLRDVSPGILPPDFGRNWTAVEADNERRVVSDERIITLTGIAPETEVSLMAPQVAEVRYLLRQIDRRDIRMHGIVSALDFLVTRHVQLERLVESRLNRKRTIVEDIRGNIIWDATKTVGAWIGRKLLGLPL